MVVVYLRVVCVVAILGCRLDSVLAGVVVD